MSKLHQSKIIQEFKTFISRGNVMDLAIGVIIGGAFSKIVSSLVADIITPIISLIIGGINLTNLSITIPNFLDPEHPALLTYGNFIQNIIDFLVIAITIFLMIRLINKANAKARALADKITKKEEATACDKATEIAEAAKSAEDEQTKLLKEIRDALVKNPNN